MKLKPNRHGASIRVEPFIVKIYKTQDSLELENYRVKGRVYGDM